MVIDEALIRQGAMIPCPWEESRITENRVGLYHGLRFFAANVELVHEYDAMMNRGGRHRRPPGDGLFRVVPGRGGPAACSDCP